MSTENLKYQQSISQAFKRKLQVAFSFDGEPIYEALVELNADIERLLQRVEKDPGELYSYQAYYSMGIFSKIIRLKEFERLLLIQYGTMELAKHITRRTTTAVEMFNDLRSLGFDIKSADWADTILLDGQRFNDLLGIHESGILSKVTKLLT